MVSYWQLSTSQLTPLSTISEKNKVQQNSNQEQICRVSIQSFYSVHSYYAGLAWSWIRCIQQFSLSRSEMDIKPGSHKLKTFVGIPSQSSLTKCDTAGVFWGILGSFK
jgi:hypothetical protein